MKFDLSDIGKKLISFAILESLKEYYENYN